LRQNSTLAGHPKRPEQFWGKTYRPSENPHHSPSGTTAHLPVTPKRPEQFWGKTSRSSENPHKVVKPFILSRTSIQYRDKEYVELCLHYSIRLQLSTSGLGFDIIVWQIDTRVSE